MKRFVKFLGVLAGAIAVFFLSTFFFLSVQGQLNQKTLARLPLVGGLFDNQRAESSQAEIVSLAREIHRLRSEIARLEISLRSGRTAERAVNPQGFFALERVQVDLGNSGGNRTLRGQFAVGYSADAAATASFESPETRYAIQDAIITLCRKKTVEDLENDRDLVGIKKEVAAAVEQALFSKGQGKVTDVYVNEFLVQ